MTGWAAGEIPNEKYARLNIQLIKLLELDELSEVTVTSDHCLWPIPTSTIVQRKS